jgi:hypothetical protein
MDMEATAQDSPRQEMGPLARMAGVFFSPARTFESIARKPGWDWIVPIVLLMAGVLFSTVVTTPRVDEEGFVQTFMKKMDANPNIPESKKAEIEQSVRGQFKFSKSFLGKLVTACVFAALVFLVPLFYHLTAMAMGAKTGYVRVLAGYAYVQMVQVVWWFLNGLIAMTKTTIDVIDLQLFRLVKSNPAAFMDPQTTNRSLLLLLSSIDLFEIWALVLGSIALSKTTRLSPKGAAMTVVSFWVLWVFLKVALGTVQAMFGA